jgi:putative FmdB family regulatory protein
MPIYEYKCIKCGEVSEFLKGVGAHTDELLCNNCGSDKLEKLISASSIITDGRSCGSNQGLTCCGREERCDKPPCGSGGSCCNE